MIKRSKLVRLAHYRSGSGSTEPRESSWSSLLHIEARHGIKCSRSGKCRFISSYSGPYLDISYSGLGPSIAFPYFRSLLTREVIDIHSVTISELFNM